MDMPIRTKRSFFYFKLNVIVEITLLAKFDYCTILKSDHKTGPLEKNLFGGRTCWTKADGTMKFWSIKYDYIIPGGVLGPQLGTDA